MSTYELNQSRNRLIDWIKSLSDVNILAFLERLREAEKEKDDWNNLTVEQQQHILRGLEEAESGKVMTSTEFWQRLKNA